jgi:hypothetical protein
MTAAFASNHASDTTEVIRANYLGGGMYNATAVKGISRPADGYGIGGSFEGGYKGIVAVGSGGASTGEYAWGVHAMAHGNTTALSYRYGVWADAFGPTSGNNLGVVGHAYGEGNAAIGIYGWAEGDDKLVWGLYGDAGGCGTGARYAVYGQTALAGDSVYAGYFSGNLVYTGSFYSLSDRMFKADIRELGGALDRITALQPRKYSYRTGDYSGEVSLPRGEHYGLIAQEVEEVFPELVGDLLHPGKPALTADDPGTEPIAYKGINYIEMIPILVQAIKEQQRTIEELKSEIEALKGR